jgi:hypothetical protein
MGSSDLPDRVSRVRVNCGFASHGAKRVLVCLTQFLSLDLGYFLAELDECTLDRVVEFRNGIRIPAIESHFQFG